MLIGEEPLAAVVAEAERELERLSRERNRRAGWKAAAENGGSWIWRVEPGMEEAFTSLRAWLLSGAGEGDGERGGRREGQT